MGPLAEVFCQRRDHLVVGQQALVDLDGEHLAALSALVGGHGGVAEPDPVGAARLVSNHEAHRLTQENLALYGQCPYTDVQEVIDNGGEGEAY